MGSARLPIGNQQCNSDVNRLIIKRWPFYRLFHLQHYYASLVDNLRLRVRNRETPLQARSTLRFTNEKCLVCNICRISEPKFRRFPRNKTQRSFATIKIFADENLARINEAHSHSSTLSIDIRKASPK